MTESISYTNQRKPVGDFGVIRRGVGYRLFNDPSYSTFDAMYEMSEAVEGYIADLATHYPKNKLWVGGSLGRREMLPNSDIDLFVIYDEEDDSRNGIRVDGVDKFEIGHISKGRLGELLQYSFIDANRFIDGRRIGHVPATDVEQMISGVSTPDRQLANNISEYFYYRYFDFPKKTTPMGPNLKYSTGSSRDTIFFNMISRMTTNKFPATRGTEPELAEVLRETEDHFDLRPPLDSINLIFTVKNAAISVYDKTGDLRSRYVSSTSLGSIFDFCADKFKALGYADARQFIAGYQAARNEVELTVDTLFNKALSEHSASQDIGRVLTLSEAELTDYCINVINSSSTENPQSVIALTAWLKLRSGAKSRDMQNIADQMIAQPIDRVWGGLMAVVCSKETPDATLSRLADWLYVHEKGAYLLKLITRNPATSVTTKAKSLGYYKDKEIII